MNSLSVFRFHSQQIRIVLINNEPWFVSLDVAKVLEYVDVRRMTDLVDDEDKQIINPHKLDLAKIAESFGSNTFRVSVINESGMYSVIFGSTKPEAKAFKRWVTSEVLPQIRKTGKYEPQQKTSIYVKRIEIATKWDIPKGHWCVFHEISLLAHKVGVEYPVAEYDLQQF